MKIRNLIVLGLFFGLPGASALAGTISSVTNVSITPLNPSPGQTVAVSWTYNQPDPFNDPRAVILVGTTCAIQSANTAGQSIVAGDGCTPGSQVNGTGCVTPPMAPNEAAGAHTVSRNITIPSNLTPGNTYYVIVGMNNYSMNLNPTLSGTAVQNCTSFTIPLPPPYIHLTKTAEGTTANVGDKVLFTIYYDAGNITTFKITDAVDPRFTIVNVYNGGNAVGQNITWNLGSIGSPKQSFVSFLAQVNSGVAGDILPNTAIGSSVEILSSPSNEADVAIAEPELSIQKSVNLSTASIGTTLTYSLNYTNGGTTLSEYQNFDNGMPPGWNNTGGTWSAAGGVLSGTAPAGTFPDIVDSTMTPVHNGIYTVDMEVSSNDTGYFDSVFVFNASDPVTVGGAYHARISSD
ncbi:MAG TPA: isopeptide-forming domain-containing fimbrial protein, partial [bacterium]